MTPARACNQARAGHTFPVATSMKLHGHFSAGEVGELRACPATRSGSGRAGATSGPRVLDGEPHVYSVEDVAEAVIVNELLRARRPPPRRPARHQAPARLRRLAPERRTARHDAEGRLVLLRENGEIYALSARGWQLMSVPPEMQDVRLRRVLVRGRGSYRARAALPPQAPSPVASPQPDVPSARLPRPHVRRGPRPSRSPRHGQACDRRACPGSRPAGDGGGLARRSRARAPPRSRAAALPGGARPPGRVAAAVGELPEVAEEHRHVLEVVDGAAQRLIALEQEVADAAQPAACRPRPGRRGRARCRAPSSGPELADQLARVTAPSRSTSPPSRSPSRSQWPTSWRAKALSSRSAGARREQAGCRSLPSGPAATAARSRPRRRWRRGTG